MKCINCGTEDSYDIIDYNPTRRISGHYIKCRNCGTKMFLAVNGEVYDTKNNQMTQAKYFQEQRILEESENNNSRSSRPSRGSYYSNKSRDSKPRMRGYSNDARNH